VTGTVLRVGGLFFFLLRILLRLRLPLTARELFASLLVLNIRHIYIYKLEIFPRKPTVGVKRPFGCGQGTPA
jgi:hypothetical protein